MKQSVLFDAKVTAPVPVPPVALSVLVERYVTVVGLAPALSVAWLAFASVTTTVAVACR